MNLSDIFTIKRPWGEFRQFVKNENVTIKIIKINKGERFSLQFHHHRSEFWKVLSGRGQGIIGDKTIELKTGDEVFVPKGEKHRMGAPDEDLEFMEISVGDFDEEDIVHLEDDYGRT